MSFLFCRLNSTDINREQTIYRSCEKLEFLAKNFQVDCKTGRIFAYSSTREQSNKRSGMRLKTESETGERR